MHFPTSLALLGTALSLSSGAAISSLPNTNTTSPFGLSAVVLATGASTPLAVEPTEASVRVLRAAAPNATSGTTADSRFFAYDAAARRLRNAQFDFGLPSDLVRENVTVTFAEFEAPADGLLALVVKQQVEGGGGSGEYFVFAPDAAGRVDGWSLCGVTAFYWSGDQAPLEGCAKVALERK
ncbi:hypothetical protein F5B18DRAFT_609232 [Nemania serpens]|nr:hypothetical protein F5B18DRAFT_609232 [Nemania serpens]